MGEQFKENPLTKILTSDNISEEEKRSIAFQVVVALREAIGFGYKSPNPPTYGETMKFLLRLDPALHERLNNLLRAASESKNLKYFKDTAKLKSDQEQTEVLTEWLIQAEIDRNMQLRQDALKTNNETISYEREIRRLKALLAELTPERVTENAALFNDLSHERKNLFAENIMRKYNYADFALPSGRVLRLRMLHPDKAEHTTGADLVYEQVDLVSCKVRFVFLQYKMWDYNDKVLYFKDNSIEQLHKLNRMLCNGNLCSSGQSGGMEFRFPYCSGFLRPTNRLQKMDSKLISNGLYIPVCKSVQMAHDKGKINKNEVQEYCLNHKVFEELFNLNLLGSRWLDFNEAEHLYVDNKILQPNGFIRLYGREFIEEKGYSGMPEDDSIPW